MTTVDLMELMASWPIVTKTEHGALVHTHCLMPSGSTVNVLVQPAIRGIVVSDNGAAHKEAISHGVFLSDHERSVQSRLAAKGLTLKKSQIFSPEVGLDEAPLAVIVVANAAREIAEMLLDAPKPSRRTPVSSIISTILRTKYAAHVPGKELIIAGKSKKKYSFENVLVYPAKKVLFDSVSNSPVSINARTLANVDIRKLNDYSVVQTIVFDDNENWTTEQLDILSFGATPIALSDAEKAIRRIVS